MMKKKNTAQAREVYPEEIRLLREAMLNNKLVIFVGAGASLDAGMPSWADAVRKIANRLGISEENLDYMKVPQYYYNSRGKKEYVELMRQIFRYHDDLDIQAIHKNIIKLNTHTIITTNYDCLLENAAFENAEFIQVIRQDKDLSYIVAGKKLIKVHGDFEHDNFVLKEDDYLHYSNNFKLIEAYVKSLIATNVILFVGYSFSDPDVKQMFSWVKDILDDDFQRAYMLDVTKEYDIYEFEYYKNLGINIIYASKWAEDFNKKQASSYTNEFLKDILEPEKDKELLEILYRECLNYSKLNYICIKYMDKILKSCGMQLTNGVIEPCNIQSSEVMKLLKTIGNNKKNDDRIKLIKEVFEKSAAETIRVYDWSKEKKITKKSFSIKKEKNKKLAKAIEEFDFGQLEDIRRENEINLSDVKPELYLEQAYISYVIFDYLQAYRYLRISSRLFYKKRNYVWFFISEVNRKNVGQSIVSNCFIECSQEEKDKIKQELAGINIEEFYRKIQVQDLEDKEFLQDLYTFRRYFSLFQDTYLLTKKTEEEAKSHYTFYMGNPGYEQLRAGIIDCYNYDYKNYIMFDRYREGVVIYRLFASNILKSACCNNLFSSIGEYGITNVCAEKLEKFDVYIILKYMKKKDLEIILSENCREYVDISDETKTYLKEIALNISHVKYYLCSYLDAYLMLITNIKLDSSLVSSVLEILTEHTEETFYISNYNNIIKFCYEADKQGVINQNDHAENLEKIIENTIKDLNKKNIQQQMAKLLSWYLKIYQNMNQSYYSDSLLKFAETNEYMVLSQIYSFCDEKIRAKIKETCSKWKWKDAEMQICTYEALVLCDLTDMSPEIEEDILKNLSQIKKNSKGIFPNAYEQVIASLINLFLNNKICLIEKIKEAIKKSGFAFFEWLVDTTNYNYEEFDILWLKMAGESLLQTVAQNDYVKKEINKCVKNVYLSGSEDKDILKIYFQYFAD